MLYRIFLHALERLSHATYLSASAVAKTASRISNHLFTKRYKWEIERSRKTFEKIIRKIQ